MNERPERTHRSKVQIDIDDRASLDHAKDNPGQWLQYQAKVKIGQSAKAHLRSWGLEVKESESRTWVRWPSSQLDLAPVAPVEVAPMPVITGIGELDTVARRCFDCPYYQYAGQIIRIKDELMDEMSARMIYLEARRDR